MLCHFRYYSLYFARLVASLLPESLYKRHMISHTRVVHWWDTCKKKKNNNMLIKIRVRFDKKTRVAAVYFRCSCLKWFRLWKGHSNMDHRLKLSTSTDKTGHGIVLIKSHLMLCFAKRLFFKRRKPKSNRKEVLCSLDIHTDKTRLQR